AVQARSSCRRQAFLGPRAPQLGAGDADVEVAVRKTLGLVGEYGLGGAEVLPRPIDVHGVGERRKVSAKAGVHPRRPARVSQLLVYRQRPFEIVDAAGVVDAGGVHEVTEALEQQRSTLGKGALLIHELQRRL